jgi:hypothetical protein
MLKKSLDRLKNVAVLNRSMSYITLTYGVPSFTIPWINHKIYTQDIIYICWQDDNFLYSHTADISSKIIV